MLTLLKKLKYLKCFMAIPHVIIFNLLSKGIRKDIDEDIAEMNRRCKINKSIAYYLTFEKPYRNLFYYRIGKYARLCRMFLPEYPFFIITPAVQKIGGGIFVLNHPYSTIINCKVIGKNFTICQLTTIGNKMHGRNDLLPSIGDNVSLGANVNILGDITIGDNVVIGAGSVVVKDVPSNCVVAGNPAKIIHKTN